MAKARIGHFVEAQVLEALEIDYIDESEASSGCPVALSLRLSFRRVISQVLTPADDVFHIDKSKFSVPFVCGCRNLGEALRRIAEGAAMIRTKGEAGTGNIVEAVRHARSVTGEIRRLQSLDSTEARLGLPFLPAMLAARCGSALCAGARVAQVYHFAKEIAAPLDLVGSRLQTSSPLLILGFVCSFPVCRC